MHLARYGNEMLTCGIEPYVYMLAAIKRTTEDQIKRADMVQQARPSAVWGNGLQEIEFLASHAGPIRKGSSFDPGDELCGGRIKARRSFD